MSPTPNPSPVKREGLKDSVFPFPSLRGEGAGVRGILVQVYSMNFFEMHPNVQGLSWSSPQRSGTRGVPVGDLEQDDARCHRRVQRIEVVRHGDANAHVYQFARDR